MWRIFLVSPSLSILISQNSEGAVPVEMLGYVEFPTVGRHLYRLTLAPYSFLWLELQRRPEPEDGAAAPEYETPLEITIGWRSVFEGPGLLRLETESLLEYLPKQRWFAGKSRQLKSARILDSAVLEKSGSALALVEVQFESGAPDVYQLVFAMAFGEAAEELRRSAPNAVITGIVAEEEIGILHDSGDDGVGSFTAPDSAASPNAIANTS